MGLNPVSDILKRADRALKSVDGALGHVDTKLSVVDHTVGRVDDKLGRVDETLTEVRDTLVEVSGALGQVRPDLFIFAHERIGGWAEAGLLQPFGAEEGRAFLPTSARAATYEGTLYGLPLSVKSLALFYNRALLADAGVTVLVVGLDLLGGPDDLAVERVALARFQLDHDGLLHLVAHHVADGGLTTAAGLLGARGTLGTLSF